MTRGPDALEVCPEEEIDLFFQSLDEEDFEDLDSDTLELREHLRCD